MDKVICVGKNYLDHAKELGDAVPKQPVIFLKPPSVVMQADSFGKTLEVALPKGRGSVHHECEIVLRLKRLGARWGFDQVTLGLDMTLRDVQTELKKNGHPWEISKVFAGSALLGPWISLDEFPGYLDEEFLFRIDGEIRQRGFGREMRVSAENCLNSLTEWLPLEPGDVLFTGTPAGVGPVQASQVAELVWNQRVLFRVRWL